MAWQPLSVRQGRRSVDGPYEGVPLHLRAALEEWVYNALHEGAGGSEQDDLAAQILAVRLRIPSESSMKAYGDIRDACRSDEEMFLDVLDYLVHAELEHVSTEDLSAILALGGSVWTVAPDDSKLERRVDSTTRTAVDEAIAPSDAASAALAEAWSKTYGRRPDPSDAWDHAIKAVEELLRPIVSPKNLKATLGSMLADLRSKPSKWTFVLGADPQGVEALIASLDLIWPNPDRHGGGGRLPTQAEAEAVVQLAVTLVQWLRAGALTLR